WGNPRRTKQLAAFGFTGHPPPAALPSRSAIARPRLSGRLPLGTLALFPPLRLGRFRLKFLLLYALHRFQIGFVWRFCGVITSSGRHCPTPSTCPGWPAACAPWWDKI